MEFDRCKEDLFHHSVLLRPAAWGQNCCLLKVHEQEYHLGFDLRPQEYKLGSSLEYLLHLVHRMGCCLGSHHSLECMLEYILVYPLPLVCMLECSLEYQLRLGCMLECSQECYSLLAGFLLECLHIFEG